MFVFLEDAVLCNLPPADSSGSALFWLIGRKIGPNVIDDKSHTHHGLRFAVMILNTFWPNEYRVFFLSLGPRAAACVPFHSV
jgi:hypothetical protein